MTWIIMLAILVYVHFSLKKCFDLALQREYRCDKVWIFFVGGVSFDALIRLFLWFYFWQWFKKDDSLDQAKKIYTMLLSLHPLQWTYRLIHHTNFSANILYIYTEFETETCCFFVDIFPCHHCYTFYTTIYLKVHVCNPHDTWKQQHLSWSHVSS